MIKFKPKKKPLTFSMEKPPDNLPKGEWDIIKMGDGTWDYYDKQSGTYYYSTPNRLIYGDEK